MKILNEIEQALQRIETDIAHVITLRKHHAQEDAGHIFADVDNKMARLKGWVEDVKNALHAGKAKIEHIGQDIRADI